MTDKGCDELQKSIKAFDCGELEDSGIKAGCVELKKSIKYAIIATLFD